MMISFISSISGSITAIAFYTNIYKKALTLGFIGSHALARPLETVKFIAMFFKSTKFIKYQLVIQISSSYNYFII